MLTPTLNHVQSLAPVAIPPPKHSHLATAPGRSSVPLEAAGQAEAQLVQLALERMGSEASPVILPPAVQQVKEDTGPLPEQSEGELNTLIPKSLPFPGFLKIKKAKAGEKPTRFQD